MQCNITQGKLNLIINSTLLIKLVHNILLSTPIDTRKNVINTNTDGVCQTQQVNMKLTEC